MDDKNGCSATTTSMFFVPINNKPGTATMTFNNRNQQLDIVNLMVNPAFKVKKNSQARGSDITIVRTTDIIKGGGNSD